MKRLKQKGFTLLEILIALAVLAMLGTLSALALGNSIDNEERLDQHMAELQALQTTQNLLRQDFQQLLPRTGRDDQGDIRRGPLISTTDINNTDLPLVEFFRNGRRLVGSQFPGSSLERVRYFYTDGQLIREAATPLDPAAEALWRQRVLLQQVEGLELAFYYDQRWLSAWPVDGVASQYLPKAVRIRLQLPRYGQVEQIILLPGAG